MDDERYYWDRLNTHTKSVLKMAVEDERLYCIVDELEGGIIAYATDILTANNIINALKVRDAIRELFDLLDKPPKKS